MQVAEAMIFTANTVSDLPYRVASSDLSWPGDLLVELVFLLIQGSRLIQYHEAL